MMKKNLLLIGLLGFFFVHVVPQNSCLSDQIRQIRVEGNTRIDTQTILSYFSVKTGGDISEDGLNSALEALFKTGFFADVVARRQGDVLVLSVVENSIINQVAFEGNKAIEDKLLTQELGLRPREVYTPARAQEAAQKIRDIYRFKGYIGAQVEPKLIKREGGRVDVVFQIQEGKTARIARISFVGNKRFSDSHLRSVILTKESAWYRIFSSDDSYEPDRIAYDQELLRQYYLRNGYVDFQAVSVAAELSPDQNSFFITFQIEEGPRYRFGKISVVSEVGEHVDLKALQKDVLCLTGDVFNNQKIEKTSEALVGLLEKKGLYFLDVLPDAKQNFADLTVDITFKVVKVAPVYVEEIVIQGNVSTDDAVIRREFRFSEGDPWSHTKMHRSKQRISGLDFFEKVEVEKEPTVRKDRKKLRVTVAEKRTGALMASAGYSTGDGPLLELKAMERNFRGKGQELELKGTIARRTRGVTLSFLEPYFMNRHLQAGVDVFGNRLKQDTRGTFESGYNQSNVGIGFRMGYALGENWFQRIRYRIMGERISNIRSKSPFLQSMNGHSLLSTVGHDIFYSNLDNVVDPTEGYSIGFSTDFTGLGGTSRFLSNTLSGGYYYPLNFEKAVILNLRAKMGHLSSLGKPLRVADRFSLGGGAFRGFGEGGLGPRDNVTQDAIGGRKFVVATAEVAFPLGLPKEYDVKGFVFTEWGSLWASGEKKMPYENRVSSEGFALRGSAGVGLRWNSPMGLLGCSFTKALRRVQGVDKIEVFRFSIGGEF